MPSRGSEGMADYLKMNADGSHTFVKVGASVHLALNSEHLLCNTATSDAADSEADESLRWHPTKRRAVTCPVCATIIRLCHGVRVGKVLDDF